MRHKYNTILPGFLHDTASDTKTLKIVQNFRDEYKRVNEHLKKYPALGTIEKLWRCY